MHFLIHPPTFPHTSPHVPLQVFCLALSPALPRKGSEKEKGSEEEGNAVQRPRRSEEASRSIQCSERSALPASFPPLARSFHNSGHPQV